MRPLLCVCPDIPTLQTGVRLIVLMHYAELKATTNTGRLATLALPESEIRVRGRKGEPMATAGLVEPGRQSLLLYPSDDSLELTADYAASLKRPLTLIVPDGTWRQASKVAKREPALAAVPRVRLPAGRPSEYRLRIAPGEHCVSTLEAIARALGVLEGAAAQASLEKLFKLVVERTLWSRGLLPLRDCQSSIPPAAVEEALLSGYQKTRSEYCLE